jgi:PAS domain S-box-containing protein
MIKFNILAKIRLAFAIVFSVMLLVAIYLFVQLNAISEQTRILYEHPFQVSNTIREMKNEIYLNENLARNIRFTDNDRALDSLKAITDRKDKFILQSFKIVSRQYLGNKASVDSSIAIYTAWKNSCDKLYLLKKDGKTDSIQFLLKNSIIVKFDSLVYSLNVISGFAENKAKNTLEEVIKVEDNSTRLSIIMLLVSCLFVVFFIWYLSRSVLRPIKTFVSEANMLLKKEEVPKVIADEKLLLLTLDKLKSAFQFIESQSHEIDLKNNQLAAFNIELEDKVELRTAELILAKNELAIQYESSRHLASIVQSSVDAIVSKSLDGIIECWNHAAEKMFGYSAGEAIGENIQMVIPPENTGEENLIFEKLLNDELIQHYETVRMKKNGERFPVSLTVSPIKDSEGKITGVSKIIRDITQRLKGEENLAASEMRYRRLFESAKDGILILDAETGMIVDVNPFMTELLGYSHKEYLGKSIWDVGHFKDIVANKENFLELQQKQYIRYDDLPLETSDGQIAHVEFISNVYLVNNQKVIQCNIRDISARKLAEEAVQKWNTQFKKLSANAPGMIYQFTRRTDGSYCVPIASEGIHELYGCSPEDVLEDFSPLAKFMHPDDIVKMMIEIEHSAKNLTISNFEYRVQLPGKAMKWLLAKSIPEKLDDGTITWYGFITDITDRKQAEDTLFKLSEQLEHIGEMAKIGGWELDIATTQLTYSRETARIHEVDFPYVPPKLSQGNEYYPPDVWPDVQAAVQAAIENGTAYDREWPFITAKGKRIWVRAQGFAVRENGKIIQLRGTFQDITERKQAEAELLKSEHRYSSLFNHMQEGFALHEIICDTNGKPVDYRFLDMNPSFELLTGLKKSEIIGKTVLTVIPDTETFWIEKYGDVALNGNPMEFENYTAPLNRHYQIKSFCPAKNQFAVLFSDITDRKRAEEVLFNTVQNLERSNKDLEQFAYVANHDLQEPLRMISSFTQLLERRYKDKLDQDANEYIRFAVDGAIRMQKLLNDLLEFSRIKNQSEQYDPVDTSALLGQAVANLQQLLTENTALVTNDDLPLIQADEAQMIRLFQNLIENAVKFHKKTELPKIHISCKKQDNMYWFSVADNGIGIEKQYHDKVFVVFQRLHSVRDYPGTGIGLSICKRIVERHGGTIWFESIVNEGTTFYFTIPA